MTYDEMIVRLQELSKMGKGYGDAVVEATANGWDVFTVKEAHLRLVGYETHRTDPPTSVHERSIRLLLDYLT